MLALLDSVVHTAVSPMDESRVLPALSPESEPPEERVAGDEGGSAGGWLSSPDPPCVHPECIFSQDSGWGCVTDHKVQRKAPGCWLDPLVAICSRPRGPGLGKSSVTYDTKEGFRR